ncbi:adenine/guanine permease AZG1 [Cinnamomum micranthum f. kanehirae]|uniref:Adenine/guanine permease AZG1 n=1 Tax=Cinnamomum micranthum f. kanehirae TaxID=337451 RepID=A0A3S4NQ25_9MAGN|nr:adenine/guanine permease AZG1 [Cinnamomum micranthum f. kanehirae]
MDDVTTYSLHLTGGMTSNWPIRFAHYLYRDGGAKKPSLSTRWDSFLTRLNSFVADSRVGKRFKLAERNSTFTTELRAGTATFLTMAYILAVNASILTDSGGTCSVSDCTPLCSNPTISLSNCTGPTLQILSRTSVVSSHPSTRATPLPREDPKGSHHRDRCFFLDRVRHHGPHG